MKKVTVYTSETCGGCSMVKKFLARKSVDYMEMNIDHDPSLRSQLMDMTGRSMVPVVVVEDESGQKRLTTGFNPSELASLVA